MNETSASVEAFDLSRHAVVEASAGTGKTYTIEQLVLRILLEEQIPLEQILVVTFTEKATGELKVRLRGMLERAAVQADGEHTLLLQQSLDHFDVAPIFTIHGFCQRLLQEYALEQQHDFRSRSTCRGPGAAGGLVLKDIERKQWRKEFGDRLRAVLDCANYNRGEAKDWERRVLAIANRIFKPRLRTICCVPNSCPIGGARLEEPDANWAGQSLKSSRSPCCTSCCPNTSGNEVCTVSTT